MPGQNTSSLAVWVWSGPATNAHSLARERRDLFSRARVQHAENTYGLRDYNTDLGVAWVYLQALPSTHAQLTHRYNIISRKKAGVSLVKSVATRTGKKSVESRKIGRVGNPASVPYLNLNSSLLPASLTPSKYFLNPTSFLNVLHK